MQQGSSRFNNVVMLDWELLLPEEVMTSAQIEEELAGTYERLKLNPGRLELLTGVRERRYWPLGSMPGDLAACAARPLLLRRPNLKNKIDLLINASVCRDQLEPATAARVHARLELNSQCGFFDLSNACLGVMQSIQLASCMIETRQIKSALIVCAENSAPLIFNTLKKLKGEMVQKKDFRPLLANLTIGSAAVAILLVHRDLYQSALSETPKNNCPQAMTITHAVHQVNSQAFELCRGEGDLEQLEMFTQSEELLKQGIQLARETWQSFVDYGGMDITCFDAYLTHQVGQGHKQALKEVIKANQQETFDTFPYLGNTGPAALPATLIEYLKIKHRDKMPAGAIALLGIGSGLSSTMLSIRPVL